MGGGVLRFCPVGKPIFGSSFERPSGKIRFRKTHPNKKSVICWGQVSSFLRFCVFFSFFRSRSLQNRPGTCLNASGVFFASKLHMEMGKTI